MLWTGSSAISSNGARRTHLLVAKIFCVLVCNLDYFRDKTLEFVTGLGPALFKGESAHWIG